jgi:hypothetical protein
MRRSWLACGAVSAGSIVGFVGLGATWLAACGGATAPERAVVDEGDGGNGDGPTGTPVQQCQAGWEICGGSCTNLLSDSNHCGTCGNVCGSGMRCAGGTCVTRPVHDAGSGLPPDPGGPAPGDAGASTVSLAFSLLRYGDTDRTGVTSVTAWGTYGLNLDGKLTTASSTDVCTLAPGAAKSYQTDGPGGVDNSFGENIMPILQTLIANVSLLWNGNLLAGDATPIVSIPQLGSGASYSPLPAFAYRAAPTTAPLAWNGMDVRNTDMGTPSVAFNGYMNQRTWVGTPAIPSLAFDLHDYAPMSGPGAAPPLVLSHVQLEMTVDPSGLAASNGNIAAVIDPKALIAWLQAFAGATSSTLCSGSAFQSIAQQLEQAQDIVLNPDGSVSNDPGTACNAISFGMGFEAKGVQLGTPVAVPPPPNPCP